MSFQARLFYIGLWNFADDNGVVEADSVGLKAKIFPADRVNVGNLVQELATIKKILCYEANGKKYIYLKNLKTHQILDRPRQSNLPLPTPDQLKSIEINGNQVGKERKGKEVIGTEGKGESSPSPKDLFLAWNHLRGELPEAKALGETRTNKCRLRLSERPLVEWEVLFSRMAKTPFLNGVNDRGWRASFDWIIANEDNAVKVLEGKYDGKARGNSAGEAAPKPGQYDHLSK